MRFLILALVLAGTFASPASAEPYIEKSSPEGTRAGVVLLIHGGGWLGDDPSMVRTTDANRDRYLRWGWGVWAIDYAGGRDSIRDVKAAYDELAASTSKPICAIGQSAGAHLSLLLADQRSFECVIGEGAPTDLDALPTWSDGSGPRTRACDAFCPDLDRFSPIYRGDLSEPVLLGHAREDYRVPIEQVRRYRDTRTGVDLDTLAPGDAYFTHGTVDAGDLGAYRDDERALLRESERP